MIILLLHRLVRISNYFICFWDVPVLLKL